LKLSGDLDKGLSKKFCFLHSNNAKGKKYLIKTRRGPKHPYTEALFSSVPADYDIKRGKKLRIIQAVYRTIGLPLPGAPF